MSAARIAAVISLALLCTGCDASMAVTSARGPWASSIALLWWIFLATLSVVFLLVVGLLGTALVRGRDVRESAKPSDRMARNIVLAGGVILPALVVFSFLIADAGVSRSLDPRPYEKALRIQVLGQQWWWEANYYDSSSNLIVNTANEIHIPVGQPVLLQLETKDVIHSFWVPQLHGKTDLIPGRKNRLVIQADQPGVYRGQCAEFCGDQHAHMGIEVVAEPKDRFGRWLEHQKQPAPEPATDNQRRGREVFLAGPCVMCHAIGGTEAGASVGPNLTHVASRRKLAAGTLPNTRGHLAGWIANAQGVKPGVLMPPITVESGDLQALLDYLQTLK